MRFCQQNKNPAVSNSSYFRKSIPKTSDEWNSQKNNKTESSSPYFPPIKKLFFNVCFYQSAVNFKVLKTTQIKNNFKLQKAAQLSREMSNNKKKTSVGYSGLMLFFALSLPLAMHDWASTLLCVPLTLRKLCRLNTQTANRGQACGAEGTVLFRGSSNWTEHSGPLMGTTLGNYNETEASAE